MTLITVAILLFGAATNHYIAPESTPLVTSHIPGPVHISHPMVPVTWPGGAAPATTASAVSCPLPPGQCYYSINWGGYAVASAGGGVTQVTGSWTVPAITYPTSTYNHDINCSDTENTWYDDSVWVGIDGAFTPTVEQTGTSSDCFYGQVSYYAWYEFYPAGTAEATITINPGDRMTAVVTCTTVAGGADCSATITDNTDHQSFASPANTFVSGALLESAEWIQENSYYEGFLALTPSTPVTFTNAQATINGHTAPIGSWGSQVEWVVLVTYNFPYAPVDHQSFNVKADPSALSRFGSSFTSTWISSGP